MSTLGSARDSFVRVKHFAVVDHLSVDSRTGSMIVGFVRLLVVMSPPSADLISLIPDSSHCSRLIPSSSLDCLPWSSIGFLCNVDQ